MRYRLLLAGSWLALLAAPRTGQAQTPANPTQPWGSWFIATLMLPGAEGRRWGGFTEAQVRTDALFRRYFYHEVKLGVSFDIDKHFTALIGGGRYSTSDYRNLDAGPLNVEKRLWGQIVLTQYSSRLKLEHRYRVEQRWFRFRDDSTSTRQRLRYRLNAFLPLNARTIGPKTVFLSAYDEIFLNPKGPVFERNRVYVGLGYQFNAHWTAQAGWLDQANYNLPTFKQGQFIPQNTAAKNNIVLAVSYRLARRGSTAPAPERLPSQQE